MHRTSISSVNSSGPPLFLGCKCQPCNGTDEFTMSYLTMANKVNLVHDSIIPGIAFGISIISILLGSRSKTTIITGTSRLVLRHVLAVSQKHHGQRFEAAQDVAKTITHCSFVFVNQRSLIRSSPCARKNPQPRSRDHIKPIDYPPTEIDLCHTSFVTRHLVVIKRKTGSSGNLVTFVTHSNTII